MAALSALDESVVAPAASLGPIRLAQGGLCGSVVEGLWGRFGRTEVVPSGGVLNYYLSGGVWLGGNADPYGMTKNDDKS